MLGCTGVLCALFKVGVSKIAGMVLRCTHEFGMRGRQIEYDFLEVAEASRQGYKSYCIRGCVIRGGGVFENSTTDPHVRTSWGLLVSYVWDCFLGVLDLASCC